MYHHSSRKFIRHIICQHQIEVEVWPSSAEVYFSDERYIDPVNSQVRFDATVYNARTEQVIWSVQNLNGGSGAGSIDCSGLYTAPNKGSLLNGTTEIIVATSITNPFRKAYAFVTLIGFGPAPLPKPSIEIFPKQSFLYNPSGANNLYIDDSNKEQLFRAIVKNASGTTVEWVIPNIIDPTPSINGLWCLVKSPNIIPPGIHKIVVHLKEGSSTVIDSDEAVIVPVDYHWPNI